MHPKLLYVAATRFPNEKAHGLAIAKMCEALKKTGYDVELVVPDLQQSSLFKNTNFQDFYGIDVEFKLTKLPCADVSGIPIFRQLSMLSLLFMKISYYWQLWFYIRRAHPDIIYTRGIWFILLLKQLQMKVLVELHDWPTLKVIQLMWHSCLSKADGIICISKPQMNELKRFPYDKRRVILIPSGVSVEFFEQYDRHLARAFFGLPQTGKIVMYCGNITKEKGIDILLKAADLLRDDLSIHFVLVGDDGSFGQTEYMKTLIKWAKSFPSFHLLGLHSHKNMPKILSAADILVVPNTNSSEIYSRYTSPLKLYEYLASGKPVLASNIPAILQAVSEEEVYFFKADQASSLVKRIREVLHNPEMASVKAQAAKRFVQEFTWDKRAWHLKKFITSL